MDSKLTLQYQYIPPGEDERLGQLPWVMAIDCPPENKFPRRKVLGRMWRADEHEFIQRREQGGIDYAQILGNWCLQRPWLAAVCVLNEPACDTWQQRDDLKAFMRGFVPRMRQLCPRLTLVLFNLSVGWPNENQSEFLVDALTRYGNVVLGLHEYSAPTMQNDEGWKVGRVRRTLAELAKYHCYPKVFITECGIDSGGHRDSGWKTHCRGDFNTYAQQIQWAMNYYAGIPQVELVAFFVAGNYNWDSFELLPLGRDYIVSLCGQSQGAMDKMWDLANKSMIPLNPEAAFIKKGSVLGLSPVSPELRENGLVFQVFWAVGDTRYKYLLWCVEGDWGNIKVDKRSN